MRRNDQLHKEKALKVNEEATSATKCRFVEILKAEDLYGKELNYDALRKEGRDFNKLLELKELQNKIQSLEWEHRLKKGEFQ